ncbi:MAG: 16S rRNA (cytosine(1402)-N(4))-methyltransferase RsmH [Candidatus Eisenbacteria bacterium]
MSARHDPVLVRETLAFLCGGPGLYLDATLGDGGHAEALLLAEPNARLLGSDRDLDSLAFARERLAPFGSRVSFIHGTFRDLASAHAAVGGERFAGALFDFGLSSAQIDDATRGMSFMHDGPLDLRMDRSRGETLLERLGRTDATELADVLKEYGDVPGAPRMARSIIAAVTAGEIRTTRQLAAVCARVLGEASPKRIAPVFQALRIWTNDEMADLEGALAWLPEAMRDGGVVVTLAYHSGEDRRVKHTLRPKVRAISRRLPELIEDAQSSPWEELTRKVVFSSEQESAVNPRARSARLRAFRRKSR